MPKVVNISEYRKKPETISMIYCKKLPTEVLLKMYAGECPNTLLADGHDQEIELNYDDMRTVLSQRRIEDGE